MRTFRVLLNGENFRFQPDEEAVGFYTTRYVEATSPQEAELVAVQSLREEPKLAAVVRDPQNPPMVYAEEIVEIEPDSVPSKNPGLAFYESDQS